MAKKKASLTKDQIKAVEELDKIITDLANFKEQAKNYKVDDVYILEEWNDFDKTVIVEKTHMGFPKKFKVVHISAQGVPYLKLLTAAGNPTGETIVPPEFEVINVLQGFAESSTIDRAQGAYHERFVPDPEQMDSILLQQEFDPMAQHAEHTKLYNEINRHNKAVAVPTGWNDFNKIADFFKSKVAGDKFWTSVDKQFVIQSVVKVGREYVITCVDMNQKVVTFNFSQFHFKRLYREQPRSFSKEKAK